MQPFKKGPDYIDPSWLTSASKRKCRNLDSFFMDKETLLSSFQHACRETDLALIEGAMGLYDSFKNDGEGSTAQLARQLDSSVFLVVDATRMARSVAALVSGYQHFEPDTNIRGVILNNVAGSRHESKLVNAIEQHCKIPVVGRMPRDNNLCIPQRHLGLIPYAETEEANSLIERIRDKAEAHIDLDAILAIAGKKELQSTLNVNDEKRESSVRIGVIYDKVFNFYYPENLESLSRAGADLVFINSLQNKRLPDIDGLYIGGGFPELFLEELQSNSSLRLDIAQVVEDDLPVYAECGGLMYLCREIQWHGQRYKMVGAIPVEAEICQKPQGHGYVVAEVRMENPWLPAGLLIRGHQFHYSRLSSLDKLDCAYSIKQGGEKNNRKDGIVYKNLFAAYTHLHASSVPQWAEAFVSLARQSRKHRSLPSAINTMGS